MQEDGDWQASEVRAPSGDIWHLPSSLGPQTGVGALCKGVQAEAE